MLGSMRNKDARETLKMMRTQEAGVATVKIDEQDETVPPACASPLLPGEANAGNPAVMDLSAASAKPSGTQSLNLATNAAS